MRNIVGLLRRFQRDEGGAFALIFAVMAIVLIALGGAAVDFTSIEQARTRTQAALDAAALALQPSIYTATTSTLQSEAQALLTTQLADGATTWANCATNNNKAPCVTVGTPVVSTTNGQLSLTANLNVPMNFVTLVGVQQIAAQVVSVATRKKLALEVAMVLDNSGSMYYTMGYNSHINNTSPTRMDTLQSSATCAANILFYGVTTCGASTTGLTANANVKMGLVPFTQFVNVGASNANSGWIDRTGAASITLNNFDNDDNPTTPFTGPIDRIALANSVKYNGTAVGWGGCVEARKNPYDTNDTPPTTGDTLYTPAFAPDEPGNPGSPGSGTTTNSESYYNSYLADSPNSCSYAPPSCTVTYTKTNCSTNSYSNCSSSATVAYSLTVAGVTTTPTSCSFVTNLVTSTTGSTSTGKNKYTTTSTSTYASNRAMQERICKYGTSSNPVSMSTAPAQGSVYGPNGDCPANAVLPLTSTPGSVVSAISLMAAQGGTNITEGAVWGWHVLSPNSPFTSQGAAYSNATSKVMIIMTDGENTIYPLSGTAPAPYNMNYDTFYSAYGYPWNNRLGVVSSSASTLKSVMDSRLTTICTNAKALGISIYTIGVDVADTTDPTGNTALLTSCASQSSYAYFPNTAADLQAAFVAIASQLAALRIAQ